MLSFFRNRLFAAVVSGHLLVDVLNSTGPVLLAFLAVANGLTNAQVGLAVTVYTLIGALSQPLFGWLTDRMHMRPSVLGGLGLAWTALGFAAVALSQRWELLLPFFWLASLGSGLFHPIGTASAALAHRERAASATSIFFFGGQVGLALGPFLGGVLIGRFGTVGMLPLCVLAAIPVALLLTAPALPVIPHGGKHAAGTVMQTTAVLVAAFIALVALRSSVQQSFMAFLPKLFADRSWQPEAFGAIAGTFMFASAVGNVVAGEIADRYGMRAATVWPLLIGTPVALVCLWAPSPPIAFVAAALAGLLVGGQHSVLVVHAQRMLPTKAGFAAGLILGFTFASGALGAWGVGWAADRVGLPLALQAATLLMIPAGLLALTLPGRARATPEPEAVTQGPGVRDQESGVSMP